PPPRPPLFPYTTLFRSDVRADLTVREARGFLALGRVAAAHLVRRAGEALLGAVHDVAALVDHHAAGEAGLGARLGLTLVRRRGVEAEALSRARAGPPAAAGEALTALRVTLVGAAMHAVFARGVVVAGAPARLAEELTAGGVVAT